MRKLFGILAAGALVVSAHTATAVPVVVPVSASLSILIQGLAPVSLSGTGFVTVETTTGAITVPAGLVTLTAPVSIAVTASTAINSITATVVSNAAGTFSVSGVSIQLPAEVCPGGPVTAGAACNSGGSNLGGAMGLLGAVNVAIIPNVVVIPVSLNDALVGQGGATTTPFVFDAAGWTTGVALVNTYSAGNTTGVTVSTTGAAGILTASGTVVLVTPTFVSALGNVLPLFTTLTLTHIPEPGTLLLVSAGVIGLAIVGRRRN